MLLVTTASAQINAAPPSVTSMGFGGRAINGTRPSVTSLGPRGYTPGVNPAFPNSHPSFIVAPPNPPATTDTHHHRHHDHDYAWGYAVPYYYGDYGYYDNGDAANYPDGEYSGGPTIFDRRGSGYVPRPAAAAPMDPPAESATEATSAPAQDQPETVLVFKDGHQLEVGNYAIVGSTLYDLSDGHRHKVPLTDLDLTATVKENDNRGIDFAVPSGSNAN